MLLIMQVAADLMALFRDLEVVLWLRRFNWKYATEKLLIYFANKRKY
jgi:hypothetical protein